MFFLQTTVNWDNDKLVCVQKGEKKNRGWTHWMEGDTLYLVSQTKHSITCNFQIKWIQKMLNHYVLLFLSRNSNVKTRSASKPTKEQNDCVELKLLSCLLKNNNTQTASALIHSQSSEHTISKNKQQWKPIQVHWEEWTHLRRETVKYI